MALALTALLAAAAACQARDEAPAARPGPPATAAGARAAAPAAGAPGTAAPDAGAPAAGAPAAGTPDAGTPDAGHRAFTLVASGDLLPHPSVSEQARFDAGGSGHDFRPMLAGVQPLVSGADLALCHLETVLGDAAAPAGRAAMSPPELAQALADAGYDGCSTASDHSLDDGAAGLGRTLDVLDRAGLRHAGTARTEQEARTVTILPAGTAKVAHLAYTFGVGGHPLPAGQPWAVNPLDEGRILADAHAARQAGADLVVASLHWGTEGQDEPDERQLSLVRTLTAAGAGGRPGLDLILGTHTRVPQAYEKVNGTWVVYGLGNQIAGEVSDRRGAVDPRSSQSTVGRFTFTPPARPGGRWDVTRAEFVPYAFDIDAGRVVDVNTALAQGADVTGVRDRIQRVVLGRGAARDGLVMGE
ncbi:CapA family protein [Streptomyces cinereospinus]